MRGCRPLTDNEVLKVIKFLKTPRDRAIFVLGIRSGFRISEILSLQVGDIFQYNQVVERVRIRAMYMKGKENTRDVALHSDARTHIEELVRSLPDGYNGPLFRSKQGGALGRKMAWVVLKEAFKAAKIKGNVATHSLRKTFAKNVYEALDRNILKTQKALGHKSLDSTVSYLEVDQNEIDSAILSV